MLSADRGRRRNWWVRIRAKPLAVCCGLVALISLAASPAWAFEPYYGKDDAGSSLDDLYPGSATPAPSVPERDAHAQPAPAPSAPPLGDLATAGETQRFTSSEVPLVFYYQNGTESPDHLTTSNAEYTPEGKVRAWGGAELTITSLIAGATVVVDADEIEYDTNFGDAEARGAVRLQVPEYALELDCDSLTYDPLLQTMEVSGIELALPLKLQQGLAKAEDQPQAKMGGHLYGRVPDHLYVVSARADFVLDPATPTAVLRDVRLSHAKIADPDLYIHAQEVRLEADQHVRFIGFSVRLSGIKVFSWPQISRSLQKRERLYSFSYPQVTYSRDVGVAWRQPASLAWGAFHTDGCLDYSPAYGLLASGSSYIEPLPGARLGVDWGERRVTNVDRVNIQRRDSYNAYYRQTVEGRKWFQELRFSLEHGEISTRTDPGPKDPLPVIRERDTRSYAGGEFTLPLVHLGGDFYFTTGISGRYAEYDDAGVVYRAVGGYWGIIWHRPDFDHYVLYRENRTGGVPVFSFDEVRPNELDFMTSIRLHPEWRHVVRGIYDLEKDEFDLLQVGAMKRMKTYEIGAYWDFARENAGLEFGLLFD